MVAKRRKKNSIITNSPSSFSQELLSLLKKYDISPATAQKELEKLSPMPPTEESFPLSIITENLTVFESLVIYLKEEREYSLHHIAEILGRNEKNLWHTYHNATQKRTTKIIVDLSSPSVPLNIFTEQKLSPLETLVVYLKEKKELSYHTIAKLLCRDDRTIWTTYMRAKKKDA
ncbi:MAG: hypothetical protein Q8R18_02805 [bacterium]|nr:hypothetical protein [bacterium]